MLGVAPEGFRGTELFYVPEIWVPMMMQAHIEGNSWLENRNTNNTCVLARIKSGVNKEQAEENLNAVGTVLGRELGWNRETTKTRNHEDTKPRRPTIRRHDDTKTRRHEDETALCHSHENPIAGQGRWFCHECVSGRPPVGRGSQRRTASLYRWLKTPWFGR